jgi:hypothetical protein
MLQQNSIQEQVIVRAMKDEAFRQELLSSPKRVLERELGITLPQGVTIQIHEDTSTTRHLVLPEKVPTDALGELSDAELEQAAGVERGTVKVQTMCCFTLPKPFCS